MAISKLAHFSVRTTNMAASKRFYIEVMGFKEGFRPPFKFPGVWLYLGGDEADYGVVHIIGIDPNDPSGLEEYLGAKTDESLVGGGAVDHIAFTATNLSDMFRRLTAMEQPYRERTVPGLGLHQLFLEDPSGITIELNFPLNETAIAGSE